MHYTTDRNYVSRYWKWFYNRWIARFQKPPNLKYCSGEWNTREPQVWISHSLPHKIFQGYDIAHFNPNLYAIHENMIRFAVNFGPSWRYTSGWGKSQPPIFTRETRHISSNLLLSACILAQYKTLHKRYKQFLYSLLDFS